MAEYIPWDKACSFTCPLTCAGPRDPDHESQAARTARLARAVPERDSVPSRDDSREPSKSAASGGTRQPGGDR